MRGWLFLCLFFGISATGWSQFTVGVQLRPRAEYRDGYRKLLLPGDEPAALISQRTRLHAKWEADQVVAYVALQDARTWGEAAQLSDIPSTGIHEAWAKVFFNPKLYVKAGRQELVWEDHRLFGNVDWAQTGRSHDAMYLGWEPGKAQVHLGGAIHQSAELTKQMPYLVSGYKHLLFARWKQGYKIPLESAVYFINEGLTTADSQSMVQRYTTGVWLKWNIDKTLRLTVSGFLQNGTDPMRKAISAYMINGLLEYSAKPITIFAGYDHVSGTASGQAENHSFNTLFGTNHKFYGHMDLFINIPAETRGAGLRDWYAGIKWNINEKWQAEGTVHQFGTQQELVDLANHRTLPDMLGFETDLAFTFKPNSIVSVKGGYSWLSASETLQFIHGIGSQNVAQWAWLMLNVNLEHAFKTEQKTQ